MQRTYLIGGVVVLIVLALYIVLDRSSHGTPTTNTPIGATTTSPDTSIVTGPTTVSGTNVPAPSLDRPITFSPNLSDAAQASISKNIQTFVTALKSDPSNATAWLYLGAYRKMAGDYEGARDAWVYVTSLAPTNPTAFANLADLYAHFIKDYPHAEVNYTKAIALDPHAVSLYVDLYYLYRDVYKVGTSAGPELLKAGLKANPGNAELSALLQGQ